MISIHFCQALLDYHSAHISMSLNEVREKVLQLENAIKRLDTVKKHLNRNASDIKAEIHANVSRNLECLRGREVSLLSQVDQVLRVKEETFQHQQARLNLTLGVLRTGLSMILDHTASEKQLAETLEKLNRIELSPEETPYISFRADHMSLRELILNYGRVDASGLPLLTAFDDPGNPSTSLPRHVEEYEDVDHHVFYKTLEEVKRTKSSASSISVKIPKLSTRVEDWLQKKLPGQDVKLGITDSPTQQSPAVRPCTLTESGGMPSVSLSVTTPGSSCSLNNWLSLIKQHVDLEEEHDFEIVDNSCSQKAGIPGTESDIPVVLVQPMTKDLKTWLYCGSGETSKFSSSFFSHIPTDNKFWLSQACQQLTSLDELKHKDLFQHISKEPSSWLRTRAFSKQQTTCQEGRDGGDFFTHLSKDKENWLQKQSKTTDKREETGREEDERSADTSSHNCKNASLKEDDKKWLFHGVSSVPLFQLEDVCSTEEHCKNRSRCASQPDCMRLCFREISPAKKSTESFRPSTLPVPEFAMIADKPIKKSPAVENEKESGSLFSHIQDVADPVWLMKSPSQTAMDVGKSVVAPDKFKDDKEEANLWLQKSSANPQTNYSSASDFCMSDWLLIPNRAKDDQLNELGENKEESDV